jgi:hypothetical protein
MPHLPKHLSQSKQVMKVSFANAKRSRLLIALCDIWHRVHGKSGLQRLLMNWRRCLDYRCCHACRQPSTLP